jgi:hypothetical protein
MTKQIILLESQINCAFSNEKFIPKRSNQIYATNEYRIANNNLKQKNIRRFTRLTDKRLHLNFRVLLELMQGQREAEFNSEYLKGKGFNFSVLTGLIRKDNETLLCIYNYLYKQNSNNTITYVRLWNK